MGAIEEHGGGHRLSIIMGKHIGATARQVNGILGGDYEPAALAGETGVFMKPGERGGSISCRVLHDDSVLMGGGGF